VAPAESDLLKAFRESFEEGQRAWNEGDVRSAYAALPDQLEYQLAPTWPESRVLRSRDEVIAFFEALRETFPDAQATSQEYIETAAGPLIAGFRVIGTGRTSGAGTAMEIWQVWQVREVEGGLTATSVREFTDRREALEAVGAAEPTGRSAQ
jgi:ketosteroid isomerase-like protein